MGTWRGLTILHAVYMIVQGATYLALTASSCVVVTILQPLCVMPPPSRTHLFLIIRDENGKKLFIVAISVGERLAELVDALLAIVWDVREGLQMHGCFSESRPALAWASLSDPNPYPTTGHFRSWGPGNQVKWSRMRTCKELPKQPSCIPDCGTPAFSTPLARSFWWCVTSPVVSHGPE